MTELCCLWLGLRGHSQVGENRTTQAGLNRHATVRNTGTLHAVRFIGQRRPRTPPFKAGVLAFTSVEFKRLTSSRSMRFKYAPNDERAVAHVSRKIASSGKRWGRHHGGGCMTIRAAWRHDWCSMHRARMGQQMGQMRERYSRPDAGRAGDGSRLGDASGDIAPFLPEPMGVSRRAPATPCWWRVKGRQ